MITQQRLKELFDYDPETGWFTNRQSRGRAKIGERAGSSMDHGYRRIIVDYKKCYEHRLVWCYVHGNLPLELDHKNGDRSDNRIDNLREASRSQNRANSERVTGMSGLLGAYWDSRSLQWFSKIQIGCMVKWLGSYNTAEEAHEAFIAAVELHHGEFALHNRHTHLEANIWPL